jgi:hypothetical protein
MKSENKKDNLVFLIISKLKDGDLDATKFILESCDALSYNELYHIFIDCETDRLIKKNDTNQEISN